MRRETVEELARREPRHALGEFESGAFEAVHLTVRGGRLIAIVPKGTPPHAIERSARLLLGELRLEDEHEVTIEIDRRDGIADVEDRPVALHPRGHAANALPHPPFAATRATTAAEIMSRQLVRASADMLVEDAAKLLAFHNISGMPVEDWDGSIIGVVTEADVIGKIGAVVGDVMSTEVISVDEAASLESVANVMSQRRIHRVFVMEGTDLRGVVSRSDLVRAVAETSPNSGSVAVGLVRDAVASV